MNRRAWVMVGYGMFLVAGALLAISISGWSRSKTALFSSGGAMLIMVGAAWLSTRPRALGKIGGWAGTLLPALFAATFFWRLTLNWAKPLESEWVASHPGLAVDTAKIQSALQNWLFPTFIAGSVVAFIAIWVLGRPKADSPPTGS